MGLTHKAALLKGLIASTERARELVPNALFQANRLQRELNYLPLEARLQARKRRNRNAKASGNLGRVDGGRSRRRVVAKG